MKRFIKPICMILYLTVLTAVAAPETKIDYAQVAEDISIMVRIIDKVLEGKFPNEYNGAPIGFLLGGAAVGGSSGCQGIYLNGYGAVFMTGINFPVAEPQVREEKPAPEDLWQQTRNELRGIRNERGEVWISLPGRGSGKYEPEKVKQLKEELIRAIGTYAHNIRQLGPGENVVVAVQGPPVIEEQATKFEYSTITIPELKLQPLEPSHREAIEEAKRAQERLARVITTPILPGKGTRTTLIIKVSKEDIIAYKEGKLDFDGFVKKAEIIQY